MSSLPRCIRIAERYCSGTAWLYRSHTRTILFCIILSIPLTFAVQGQALLTATAPAAICTPPIQPVTLTNPTAITNCTQAGVQAALNQGGHITFNCGPNPVTIKLTAPLKASATVDTVIDGGGRVTLDGDNLTRILEKPFTPGSDVDKTKGNRLTVQNLRFINGRAPAATKQRDGNARGGAIWIGASPGTRLHIINSTFENNRTTSTTDEDNQGGAVYAANIYETVIVGSVFDKNEAGSGGAFGGIATGLLVYNSRFTANKASDGTSGGIVRGHGGAIHLDGVSNNFNPDARNTVDICGSVFEGNTATRGGGATKVTISDNLNTKATYARSAFINNRIVGVPPTEGHGGAIYHIEDDLAGGSNEDNIEIRESTFRGNYAYRQGGAAWITVLGRGRIVNSTFSENRASEAGSNRVGQGGALIISRGIIDVLNSTFAANFATFQGGAIFAGGAGDAQRVVTLKNSLFYQNKLDPTHTNPATSEWQGYHTNRPLENGGGNLQFPRNKQPDFNNEVNNLITTPATAIIFADPLLGPLADNGGPHQTMALAEGSPAINAGVSGCPATDQRSAARVGACDIGAFEYGSTPPVTVDLTLTSITPTSVIAGTTSNVTLMAIGTGFTSNSIIRWNGANRPTTFVSSTRLTTVITSADMQTAGNVAITVYDASVGTNGTTTAPRTLSITADTPPVTDELTLTSITPATVAAGTTSNVTLTAIGTGFTSNSIIRWNGTDRPTTFVSGTELTTVLSIDDMQSVADIAVTVYDASVGDDGTETAPQTLRITAAERLTLTSINPSMLAVGTSNNVILTATGTGFTLNSAIRWNGRDRATNFISSTTLITIISPSEMQAAATIAVTVYDSSIALNGTETAPQTLRIMEDVPPPVTDELTLTSITPVSVTAGTPMDITLTAIGTDFTPSSVIRWNGTDRLTTFVSSTELTMVITSADMQSAADIAVTVYDASVGEDGTETAPQTLRILEVERLTLIGISPAMIAAGATSDITLTVIGMGFTPGSVIRWNGTDLPTLFVSSTELTTVISPTELEQVADVVITVYDDSIAASGTETVAQTLRILEEVFTVHLPLIQN